MEPENDGFSKRNFLFWELLFRFDVKFRGCIYFYPVPNMSFQLEGGSMVCRSVLWNSLRPCALSETGRPGSLVHWDEDLEINSVLLGNAMLSRRCLSFFLLKAWNIWNPQYYPRKLTAQDTWNLIGGSCHGSFSSWGGSSHECIAERGTQDLLTGDRCQIHRTVHPWRLTAGTYNSPIWKGKWSSKPPWLRSMLIFRGVFILFGFKVREPHGSL